MLRSTNARGPLLPIAASRRFFQIVAFKKSLCPERVRAPGSTVIEIQFASQKISGLAWKDPLRSAPVSRKDGKPSLKNNQLQALEAPSPPGIEARTRIVPEIGIAERDG